MLIISLIYFFAIRFLYQTKYLDFVTPSRKIKPSLQEQKTTNRQTIAALNQLDKLSHLVRINCISFIDYIT